MEQQSNKPPRSESKWNIVLMGVATFILVSTVINSVIDGLDPLVEVGRVSAAQNKIFVQMFAWWTISRWLKLDERFPKLSMLVYIAAVLAFIYTLLVSFKIIAPLSLAS